MRLIIAYKFVKAFLMIGLALWFTADPEAAYSFGQHVAYEFVEARPFLVRLGEWIHTHLTERVIERSALVAWLDGLTTGLEGFLLLLGKPWGEWLVVISLSLFLPFEVYELIHKPGAGKAIVLLLNAAIVVYLVYARLLSAHRARSGQAPPAG
ncbi:DUF2127 domain-containing protein [Cystobacter fuscus]|uniref:DUF2127 domain-containing protein n=1 Tax=Cystobacter fuscus TaxID=43 RepID=UPI002B28F92C|nr:DUF2127 domain-containing protein [Cystobacter fuscus]